MMSQHSTPEENIQMMTELLTEGPTDDMYYKIMDFWDDPVLVEWFRSHGYTLYRRVVDKGELLTSTMPALPFDEVAQASYPYAHHDARQFADNSMPLRADDVSVR
jgi:hypothetical protein